MPEPPRPVALGIDVGGTALRLGVVDRSGRVLVRRRYEIADARTVESLIDQVARGFAEVSASAGIEAGDRLPTGLALPGPLDRDRKRLVRSINLPFLEDVAIADQVEGRIGVRPLLLTDGEAATWGEYAAQTPKAQRMVHLRLGTGIACGAVIDGRLERVDADRKTHLDLLVVDPTPNATPCRCGLRGCLETVASGRALEAQAQRLGFADLAGLNRGWQRGDQAATRLIRHVVDALVVAVDRLATRYQASVIVLGGGVMERLPDLPGLISSRPPQATERPRQTPPALKPARLGDDAGVVGAALLGASHV